MPFPTMRNLTLPRLAAKLDAAAIKLRKSFKGSKRPTAPMTISSALNPKSARALALEFECWSKTEKSYPLGITVILRAAYPSLICATLADWAQQMIRRGTIWEQIAQRRTSQNVTLNGPCGMVVERTPHTTMQDPAKRAAHPPSRSA